MAPTLATSPPVIMAREGGRSWSAVVFQLLLASLVVLSILISPGQGMAQYEFFTGDSKANWSTANSICEQRDAQLAYDLEVDDWELTYGTSRLMSDLFLWIGLRKNESGSWEWTNRQPVDMTDTYLFPLQPNYSSIIHWDCVQWNVMEPFFVPENCSAEGSFLCQKPQPPATCSFNRHGNKTAEVSVSDPEYTSLAALETANLSQPVFYNPGDLTLDQCQAECGNLSLPSNNASCWLFQYRSDETVNACRLLVTQGKPVIINVTESTHWDIYAKYCLLVEEVVGCEKECFCTNASAPSTVEEAVEEGEKLKKELIVPKGNLSATIRKKQSMPDQRPSSTGIGFAGISIMVVTFGSLVLLDLSSIVRDVKMMIDNVKRLMGKGDNSETTALHDTDAPATESTA